MFVELHLDQHNISVSTHEVHISYRKAPGTIWSRTIISKSGSCPVNGRQPSHWTSVSCEDIVADIQSTFSTYVPFIDTKSVAFENKLQELIA